MASWLGGWGGWGAGAAPTTSGPPTLEPAGTQPRSSYPSPSSTFESKGGGGGTYSAGEMVEYFSATTQRWIPAKVVSVNGNGTYNLDCKPEVQVDKIRRPSGAGAGGNTSTSSTPLGTYAVGDMVEYFSASQNDWILAKVTAVNPKGTYDLDCKPQVPPNKIRRREGRGSQSLEPPGSGAGGAGKAASPSPRPDGGGAPALASSVAPRRHSGTEARGGVDEPTQLLRVRRDGNKWRYEVCEEGARMLERHGSRRIAIASICGVYRTGKSYLLNLLLERVQRGQKLFQVGGTTRACTEGLWLWGSVDAGDDQSPLLAFIDCEGFGSTTSDKTRDAQLMTLCALLSSALVLNTKGALNEGVFNALSLTCKFAEHIEERGNEASRPALLWVLRDFMLELRDKSGNATTPDEYLEQALHAAPLVGHDQDRGQAAREVRQNLLQFFSHRSCVTLVQPAIEEKQLQRLETMSYSSLRGEFRAGVEALRTQLIATCRANPKTIGGQPLGCFALASLLRQFADALNNQKVLSVKGAWETVQHTACGSLADELRTSSCAVLRVLGSGQTLPGGAQLPLTDEALRMVLRQRRHELKAQWEDRAVGDEAVRKEYWQELKESLAREEAMVRQQNCRLADLALVAGLKSWQDWLDDDGGSWSDGDRVSRELGELMERMPAAPLSRTSRAALEAAGRRVAAARSAAAATVEQSEAAQRQAVAFGEQAAQQHGVARSELEVTKKELEDVQDRLKHGTNAHETTQVELESRTAELRDSKFQLQALLDDVEAARVREQELKAQNRHHSEMEASVRNELEQVRAQSARAEADFLASERCTRSDKEAQAAELRRLEAELEVYRAQATEKERVAAELESVRNQATSHGQEKTKLETELEHARGEAQDKIRLEKELEQLRRDQASEKSQQASEKSRLESELEYSQRMQASERTRLEAELEQLRLQVAEKRRLEVELEKLRHEANEKLRLEHELEHTRSKVDGYARQLDDERATLRGEHEKTRAEHARTLEDTRRQMDEERKVHADMLEGEKNRLLDGERTKGKLEGHVHALSAEAQILRERVAELQAQVNKSENDRGRHVSEKEKLIKELEETKAEQDKVQETLRAQTAEYERRREEADSKKKSQKKCCVVM